MILRACTVCGAPSDESRCPAHRPTAVRASASARGYGSRWRRTRRRFLREHPFCDERGCPRLAEHVHHVDLLGPLGPRGHDPENLRALCAHHHGVIHGGWTTGHDQ